MALEDALLIVRRVQQQTSTLYEPEEIANEILQAAQICRELLDDPRVAAEPFLREDLEVASQALAQAYVMVRTAATGSDQKLSSLLGSAENRIIRARSYKWALVQQPKPEGNEKIEIEKDTSTKSREEEACREAEEETREE